MKLKLNREYALRHVFSAVVMAALGLWFGFDGVVRYPATPAAELYRSIEKSEPPPGFDLDGFKRQKIQSQYGFSAIALLAALVVGLRLLKEKKFSFEFDESGFTARGKRFSREDIAEIDESEWTTKSKLHVRLKSGGKITLDAWHHTGVKDFHALYAAKKSEQSL